MGKKKDSDDVAAQKAVWDYAFAFWMHRNETVHGTRPSDQYLKKASKLRERLLKNLKHPPPVVSTGQYLFN